MTIHLSHQSVKQGNHINLAIDFPTTDGGEHHFVKGFVASGENLFVLINELICISIGGADNYPAREHIGPG
jgi:hypothetical protein